MWSLPEPASVAVETLLSDIVALFETVLTRRLIGVYLHGSLAMGGFNPAVSDVDFLVVARDGLDISTKSLLIDGLVALSERAPPKGLEMSVVTTDVLEPFCYPTPFELHFSRTWLKRWRAHEIDLHVKRSDPDLAAHVATTIQRGVTLSGAPIAEVFSEVPREAFLASVRADARDSTAQVYAGPDRGLCQVPTYAVLNLCRILAYLADGVIRSKREGGRWALTRLPGRYRRLVDEALRDYSGMSPSAVDAALLKEFIRWGWSLLGEPTG